MTERAKQWQALVAQWAGSGQTQVAFCRQRRIEPGTFAWWKRQLRQKGLVPRRRQRGLNPARWQEGLACERRPEGVAPEWRQKGLAGHRRDRSGVRAAVAEGSGRFVEVGGPSWSCARFEVVLGHGRTIRVPAGFDEQALRRLLRVLEGVC